MRVGEPSQGQAAASPQPASSGPEIPQQLPAASNVVVDEPVAKDVVVDEPSKGQELPRADPVASDAATSARAEVKYTTLLEQALTAMQDLEDEGLYLVSAEN